MLELVETACEATKPLQKISAIFEKAWPYAGYILNNTLQGCKINYKMFNDPLKLMTNRAKDANDGFPATVRRALKFALKYALSSELCL